MWLDSVRQRCRISRVSCQRGDCTGISRLFPCCPVDRCTRSGRLDTREDYIMTDDLPLFQPTPLQRRMIDAAVEIEEFAPDTVEFLHSVLWQVGLPRSTTQERRFEPDHRPGRN